MTEPVAEQHGNRIHFWGSFNPRIFQPAWLAAQGLIREAESENAEIGIVHSEVVSYALDWARIEVERERLAIASTGKSETPEQLRDLAIGVLEILSHTPVYLVGLQFWGHYALKDQEARDRLGRTLAPPEPFERHLVSPGVTTLRMTGGRPDGDDPDGDGLSIVIEPSNRVKPNGVYISIADQYDLADEDDPGVDARLAIACLKNKWSSSLKRAGEIPSTILSLR